jgi:hypothetical protein
MKSTERNGRGGAGVEVVKVKARYTAVLGERWVIEGGGSNAGRSGSLSVKSTWLHFLPEFELRRCLVLVT